VGAGVQHGEHIRHEHRLARTVHVDLRAQVDAPPQSLEVGVEFVERCLLGFAVPVFFGR
jgi:hypothetical protein